MPVDARFPGSAIAVFMNTSLTTTATVAINVTGDRVSRDGPRHKASHSPHTASSSRLRADVAQCARLLWALHQPH